MHTAAIDDSARAGSRAITGQDFSQIGQPHIRAVLCDQLGHAAVTFRARHVEHWQPIGNIAECDHVGTDDQ